MTQIAILEKIISLNTKVRVTVVKTILDIIFEIDGNSRDKEIDLIVVLLQLDVLGSEIRFLETIVVHLVYCL